MFFPPSAVLNFTRAFPSSLILKVGDSFTEVENLVNKIQDQSPQQHYPRSASFLLSLDSVNVGKTLRIGKTGGGGRKRNDTWPSPMPNNMLNEIEENLVFVFVISMLFSDLLIWLLTLQ